MVKVLQIRETPLNKCAGIDANCQGLIRLFLDDEEIKFFPTVDYSRHSDPFIHQYWLDKQEICDSIQKFNPDVVHIHGAYSFTLLVAVKCVKKFHKKKLSFLHIFIRFMRCEDLYWENYFFI